MPRTDSINFDYWKNELDQQVLDEMLADIEAERDVLGGDAIEQLGRLTAPLPSECPLTHRYFKDEPMNDEPLIRTGQGSYTRDYTPSLRSVGRRRGSVLRWLVGGVVLVTLAWWRIGF